MPASLRIALAQFRPVIGDLERNAARIADFALQASRAEAALLVCPEQALLGYPPDDLLQRPGLPQALERALERLSADLPSGLRVVLGAPEFAAEAVYNAAWLLGDGLPQVVARKQALPNFGVFDERRHFRRGTAMPLLTLAGARVRVLICEDLWDEAVAAPLQPPADLTLVINASPFDQGKRAQRAALLCRRSQQRPGPLLYLNMVGGQDELVFDGDTQVWQDGLCINRRTQPEEALWLQDLSEGQAQPMSWNQTAEEDADGLLYQMLCTGLRDYFTQNGFTHAYLGLSGGVDSALVLALAADVLGPDKVTAVAMPSVYTADMSLQDAEAEAKALGVAYRVAPIAPLAAAFEQVLAPWHAELPADTTEENLQARARGALLMAMANKTGGLVLATGNKSEMAVGYCTLYGDMCGGYAPIKDVYKMQVYALSRWRNAQSPVIPERVLTRAPSAELRPDQRDEDSLPAHPVLDEMLRLLVEEERSAEAVMAAGFDPEQTTKVQRLLRLAEFKRRQSAPGPKVTPRAFGRERRYPITARYPAF